MVASLAVGRKPDRRNLRTAAAALLGTVALSGLGLIATASATSAHPAAGLVAHTVLKGASHGWTSPDDLTQVGEDFYVSFQNGVPSDGPAATGPRRSTIVKFRSNGQIQATWQLLGKCDGLTADREHHRVIATVNEDGNSSLYTLPTTGASAATHYAYDASPLPHGGGTDSITIYHDHVYVVASAPAAGGPTLYEITLSHGVAHLAAAPFYDTSIATVANTGSHGEKIPLKLTDPDSSTVVPSQSKRFAGSFMLTAQGDQQAVFASRLGSAKQALSVLNLSQAVDDTAFTTGPTGALITTDSTANSVVMITGRFAEGIAYTAVTPGNANSAPPAPGPNYLGTINLRTGTITDVRTTGVTFEPHALIYTADPS